MVLNQPKIYLFVYLCDPRQITSFKDFLSKQGINEFIISSTKYLKLI
ncbi:conserved hypothetical protein [Xenorhabdus bovienii str. Jollieti]|uniref:Uncharacterized protein n=1 Tax=Xenorhabdus bovienii (strain SS-2004) TaxID=406818 RepID=D3V245_XENBS|nr:conserved hypothetical protein [Xenorhabdus bovienii SS-2004]CDH27179.1 conserved hypothetical protein [Xenorhabdus bovienii str. Jollieti]